jgi:hypothetical protein
MNMKAWLSWFAFGVGALGCSDNSTFTLGRNQELCVTTVPTACGIPARCVIDDTVYIQGTLPGSQAFIVRTDGEIMLNFHILLTDRLAPGTVLRLVANEPTCGQHSTYDSEGTNLFQLTGEDGALPIPLEVHQAGDHLVELSSDAYCDYSLIVDNASSRNGEGQ